MDNRMFNLESQTKTQWQKLSKIETNSTSIAVMNGKLDTILNILKESN